MERRWRQKPTSPKRFKVGYKANKGGICSKGGKDVEVPKADEAFGQEFDRAEVIQVLRNQNQGADVIAK